MITPCYLDHLEILDNVPGSTFGKDAVIIFEIVSTMCSEEDEKNEGRGRSQNRKAGTSFHLFKIKEIYNKKKRSRGCGAKWLCKVLTS